MSYRFVLTTPFARERAVAAILGAPAGYVASIQEPRRTVEQNAKMHAMLSDVAISKPGGRRLLPHQWKSLFMDALERETNNAAFGSRWEPALDGEGVVNLGYRSSKLRKSEMGDLIAFIEAWGTQNGVQWTDPGAPKLEDAAAMEEFLFEYRNRAQGTEARRAGTVEQGPVHDGPVAESHAPNISDRARTQQESADE